VRKPFEAFKQTHIVTVDKANAAIAQDYEAHLRKLEKFQATVEQTLAAYEGRINNLTAERDQLRAENEKLRAKNTQQASQIERLQAKLTRHVLTQHEHGYFEHDTPLISDAEYDRLHAENERLRADAELATHTIQNLVNHGSPHPYETVVEELRAQLAEARGALDGLVKHCAEAHYDDCSIMYDLDEEKCDCGSGAAHDKARAYLEKNK
jgi:chromosome segregation ATPase